MTEQTLPKPIHPYAPPTAHTPAFAKMFHRLSIAVETDGPGLSLISSQNAPTDDERTMLLARRADLWTALTAVKSRGAGPAQALAERILRMFYAWPTVKLDEMKAIGVAKTYAEQVSHLPLWAIDAAILHLQGQNEPFPPSAGQVRAAAEAKAEGAHEEIRAIGRIVDAKVFTEQPRGQDTLLRVREVAERFKSGVKAAPPPVARRDRNPRLPSRFDTERAYDPDKPVTASPELLRKLGAPVP